MNQILQKVLPGCCHSNDFDLVHVYSHREHSFFFPEVSKFYSQTLSNEIMYPSPTVLLTRNYSHASEVTMDKLLET